MTTTKLQVGQKVRVTMPTGRTHDGRIIRTPAEMPEDVRETMVDAGEPLEKWQVKYDGSGETWYTVWATADRLEVIG